MYLGNKDGSMISRNEYAQICKAVYGGDNELILNTAVWTHIDLDGKPTCNYIDDKNTIDSGFCGGLYGKDINYDGVYEEIVVAYRGTESSIGGVTTIDDIKDIFPNDIGLGFNIVPDQYQSALKLYNDATAKFGSDKVTVTGHSLGGILTQLVCAKTDAKGVTFNAAGVKSLLPQIGVNPNKEFSNITNYIIENNFLHSVNNLMGFGYVGKTYMIPSTNEDPLTAHNNFKALAYAPAILPEPQRLANNNLVAIYPSIVKPIGSKPVNNLTHSKNKNNFTNISSPANLMIMRQYPLICTGNRMRI